jgi:hypothetical protein
MNEFKQAGYLLERHINSTTSQSEAPRSGLIRAIDASLVERPPINTAVQLSPSIHSAAALGRRYGAN